MKAIYLKTISLNYIIMKIPVLKRKDKYYIQLPSELKEEELTSLELIQLKEGYYLLSTKLNTAQEPKKDANNSSLTNVDDASSTAVKSSILQNVKSKTSQETKKEEESVEKAVKKTEEKKETAEKKEIPKEKAVEKPKEIKKEEVNVEKKSEPKKINLKVKRGKN